MPIKRTPFASSACSLLLALLLTGCVGGNKDEDPAGRLLAGTIEWGTEGGMFFRACGSEALVVLRDPDGLLEEAHSFASVYAHGSQQSGWTVSRVNYVPSEGFGCGFDWNGTLWRAAGNEPFWSARLQEDGLSVRMMDSAVYVEPVRVDGLTFVSLQTSMELKLTEGLCRDTMADTQYGYSARLTIDGVVHTGCAFQGLAAEVAP